MVENLLQPPTATYALAVLAISCYSLGIVTLPVGIAKSKVGRMLSGLASGLFAGVAATLGSVAIGYFCLPEGVRALEVAVAIGLVGAVVAYRWRRRVVLLPKDSDERRRLNKRLRACSMALLPVTVVAGFYSMFS